jgi:hypothetical protein
VVGRYPFIVGGSTQWEGGKGKGKGKGIEREKKTHDDLQQCSHLTSPIHTHFQINHNKLATAVTSKT